MARYTAPQDPTLFDLIEAGADDNLDLILAQLFAEDDLALLLAALVVARGNLENRAKANEGDARYLLAGSSSRARVEAEARRVRREAERLTILIAAMWGPAYRPMRDRI